MSVFANRRWRPWAGLVAGPAGWAVHHQTGSSLNFTDCQVGTSATLIAIGLLALGLTAVGALVSFGAWRGGSAQAAGEPAVDRFIATLALMVSGLAGLTILVQIGASVVLPPCFR
jgi:hypothetical protein